MSQNGLPNQPRGSEGKKTLHYVWVTERCVSLVERVAPLLTCYVILQWLKCQSHLRHHRMPKELKGWVKTSM